VPRTVVPLLNKQASWLHVPIRVNCSGCVRARETVFLDRNPVLLVICHPDNPPTLIISKISNKAFLRLAFCCAIGVFYHVTISKDESA